MDHELIARLDDEEELRNALLSEVAVFYKHSPVCPVSARAIEEIRSFAESHPEAAVYLVDVVKQREISQQIASLLGVPHESPQAIVVERGEPVWDCSHYDITASSLSCHVGSGGPSP